MNEQKSSNHDKKKTNNYNDTIKTTNNSPQTLLACLIIGILAGLVSVLYRITLTYAEKICFAAYDFLRERLYLIPVAIIVLSLMGYFTGWLTSRYKLISGSGIPQVKGIIIGHFKPDWLKMLIAKFVGGTVAVLAGLSVGREGPSVHLGASVGGKIGQKFAKTRFQKRIFIASGASAGLAAAFNAPLAGVVFCLEELFKYFSPLLLLSTMLAAVAADFVSKLVFGLSPVFHFEITQSIPLKLYGLLLILGAILGVAGAFYNHIVLFTQKLYKKIKFPNTKIKMIVPFLFSGILAFVFPIALCGGHVVMEELSINKTILFLLAVLIFKFIHSMVSFGSGAPGGIFFPLLVIGATIGAIFAKATFGIFGIDDVLFGNFIILAMAGYFTAIVRAPITGIILLIEMTGSFNQLLPLTIVSLIAYIVADLLKSTPIYDSLLQNLINAENSTQKDSSGNKKIVIEKILQFNSIADSKLVKDISFPSNCLLVAVKRDGKEFIPNGSTKLLAGDYLVFLTDLNCEIDKRDELDKLISL